MPEIDLGSVVGPQGEQGVPGPAGAEGKQGPVGATGEAGKSAYQAARDGGYTGTEAEFNAILAIIEKHAGRHKTGGSDPLTAADVGAAPAGFGLGTAELLPDGTDLNTVTKNGWYYWYTSPEMINLPDPQFSAMRVWTHLGGACMQECVALSNDEYWGTLIRRMVYGQNTVTPWEWINPPMQVGVEYRTTERFDGKPVYAKQIRLGQVAEGLDTVEHGVDNISLVVRYQGASSVTPLPIIYGPSLTHQYSRYIAHVDHTHVTVYSGSVSESSVFVTLYYLKR